MGCWNKTCGISNLHINAGHEVVVIPLIANAHWDTCYTTAFYRPAFMPFYSSYNDATGCGWKSRWDENLVCEDDTKMYFEYHHGPYTASEICPETGKYEQVEKPGVVSKSTFNKVTGTGYAPYMIAFRTGKERKVNYVAVCTPATFLKNF